VVEQLGTKMPKNSLSCLANVCEPIVDSYRDTLRKKAEYTLSTAIPEQLCLLQTILADPKIKLEYTHEVRSHSVSSITEFERQLEEINQNNQAQQMEMEKALKMLFGGGGMNKDKGDETIENEDENEDTSPKKVDSKIVLGKRKRSNSKTPQNGNLTLESKDSNLSIELKLNDNDGEEEKNVEEKVEEIEQPTIGINQMNFALSQMLKPFILNLYDTCVLLRNWIVLLIPKVEDGNNFGVEVQETCLSQVKQIEIEMLMAIEEQAAYHLERATIISKVSTNIEILDYKQYIYDADERHCRKLQDAAMNLRSSYNKLYRTITQNYDKITAPRGINNNHLHLY